MFGATGKAVGSIAEALAFQGDSGRLNPMRYIPTPGHTKAWQERTPLAQYLTNEVVGTRMRRWERPIHDFLTRSLRPAATKTPHAPAREETRPCSLAPRAFGILRTGAALQSRHALHPPALRLSFRFLRSASPDQLSFRLSNAPSWLLGGGVSGLQRCSEFSLCGVAEVRLHFVQLEGGGSHFPLPSTGTYDTLWGSIRDKVLLVITRPTR